MKSVQKINSRRVDKHINHEAAQAFVESLPEQIRYALEKQAQSINYPIEAVLEMAIAGYLDDNPISFNDCNPKLDWLLSPSLLCNLMRFLV
jgi:hypothetical protein